MKFQKYITKEEVLSEGTLFQNLLKKLGNKSTAIAKKIFKDNWIKIANIIKKKGEEDRALQIINKNFETNYKSLDQISKAKIREEVMNEDFAHFWDFLKDQAFPTLSFYPALTAWLELDKLLSGGDFNLNKTLIYAAFWLLLVSGKFVKSWKRWKQQNPEQWEKEGAKKHPFAL